MLKHLSENYTEKVYFGLTLLNQFILKSLPEWFYYILNSDVPLSLQSFRLWCYPERLLESSAISTAASAYIWLLHLFIFKKKN